MKMYYSLKAGFCHHGPAGGRSAADLAAAAVAYFETFL